MHDEIRDLLAEVDTNDTAGNTIVILRCRSSYIGKIVNGRWLVVSCRGSFCKGKGKHRYHVIDITTGKHRNVAEEPFPAHRQG